MPLDPAPVLTELQGRLLTALRRKEGRVELDRLAIMALGFARPGTTADCRTALAGLRAMGIVGCSVEDDVAYYWLFPDPKSSESLVKFLSES